MTSFRYTSTLFITLLLLSTTDFAAAQNAQQGSDSEIALGWAAPFSGADVSSAVAPSAVARGGAGTLDPTFGTEGLTEFLARRSTGLLFQPDGKILVAGRFGTLAAVFRFNPDGTPDTSFGSTATNFYALAELGPGTLDTFNDIALQQDGKIVAAGGIVLPNTEGRGDRAAVARFHPDGTLDETFGTDGLVFEPGTPESDTPDLFRDVHIRSDGRIIAGGHRGLFGFDADEDGGCYAVQYLLDGSRDPEFGTDGLVSVAPDLDMMCENAVLMDDGRYVLGALIEPGPPVWAAVRLLADGTPDPTFGTDGIAQTTIALNVPNGIAVGPDGSVTLAGSDLSPVSTLVRFTPEGVLDSEFGNLGEPGIAAINLEGPSIAWDVALQSDGKLLVTGWSRAQGVFAPYLARVLPDGMIDLQFGTAAGFTPFYEQEGEDTGIGRMVSLDAEDRIIVVGENPFVPDRMGFIARFENDVTPIVLPGGLDATFGTDGVTVFEAEAPVVIGVAFQPDGKVLTGGRVDGDAAVFRFNTDGSFDQSFGTEGVATADLGGAFDTFLSLALQDDGKIVAAGSILLGEAAGDGDGAALARFNADGTLDTSFGTDGVIVEPGTPESGTPDAYWHVAVRPTGEIVAAGSQGIIFVDVEANACYAAQYLPDGSRDMGFGDGGLVSTIPEEDVFCLDGELLNDGRYVLGVNVEPEPFMSRWGAVRLLPDGSYEASYGEDGVFVLDEAAPLYSPSMVAGPDGSTTHGSLGDDETTRLVRFSSDGTLDTSYGEGGFAILDGLGTSVPWDLALQPDGKILMSGFKALDNNVRVPFLARAEADGTIDASFGADGEGVTYIELSSSDSRRGNAFNLGLDDENRIVVSGIVDSNASPVEAFVARFENDVTVSVEAPATPQQLALASPYPNPTHSTATLEFVLSEATDVQLVLYDILGREVAVVAEGTREAGTHTATFDTSRLASGLYVVRLTAGSEAATRRLTVIR